MTLIGFNIYRDGNLITPTPLSPEVTEYEDAGLAAGTTYRYYVTAVYDEGESMPSNEIELTPYALPTVYLDGEAGLNKVTLIWTVSKE